MGGRGGGRRVISGLISSFHLYFQFNPVLYGFRERQSKSGIPVLFIYESTWASYPEYQLIHLKDEDQMTVVGIIGYICMPGTPQAFSKD